MPSVFGPLDEVLGQLLETWDHRYAFEFDREQRVITFRRGDMVACADEHGHDLVVVSYEWGQGEVEAEFCTPDQAAALIDAVMARKELCRLPRYGRPPMLVMEFAKGSAKALALEFYPENGDAFARELRRVKLALLDWKAKHGDRCETVMFTVVSAPEHHSAIESEIQRVCLDEAELAPLLRSLEVRVGLFVDPRGDPVKEYILAKVSRPNAPKARAWWRFW
jgi:hypothetical protein